MDKNWKLQRYDRKDYTELVDFPVEIVGRDGVVRRYTFEDSIRLYQRRITFAPIRYRDSDVIRAEVNHCRSRIDQLRRSYFHRFGWGTPPGHPSAEEVFGDLAGELAAFLCRVLRCEGRPDIRFELITNEQNGVSTWYVTPDTVSSGMILYVHRFDGSDSDTVREAFFSALKFLERMGRTEGDGERLLAFHHTVDCGFVLTGRGSEYAALVPAQGDVVESTFDLAPTPWDHVLDIIRRGEYEAALRRCRDLAEAQPFHRNAYVAGSMLAAFLGEVQAVEDLALLGTRYFPEDGMLRYFLGVARMRSGQPGQAEEELKRAVSQCPDMVAARAVLAVLQIRQRKFSAARATLSDRSHFRPDDRRGDVELERLAHWLRWRTVAVLAGWLMAIVGVLTVAGGTTMGLIPVAVGVTVLVGGWVAFHRQVEALLARHRFEEIAQGLRRLHRRNNQGPLVS